MKRIGVDIGGVLIEGSHEEGLFFSENYLECARVEGSFESVAQLVRHFGADSVFLVSKCSETIQRKTLKWLETKGFFQGTGFFRHQVHFCRNRKDKATIAQSLGLSAFIDDRFAVLQHMLWMPELYLFKPSEKEHEAYKTMGTAETLCVCQSWLEVLEHLLA